MLMLKLKLLLLLQALQQGSPHSRDSSTTRTRPPTTRPRSPAHPQTRPTPYNLPATPYNLHSPRQSLPRQNLPPTRSTCLLSPAISCTPPLTSWVRPGVGGVRRCLALQGNPHSPPRESLHHMTSLLVSMNLLAPPHEPPCSFPLH